MAEAKARWRRRIGWLLLVLSWGALGGVVAWIIEMPGSSYKGPLVPLDEAEAHTAERLRRSVRVLAEEIGPRAATDGGGLARAEDYLRGELEALGYEVHRLPFEVYGREVANLEAVHVGRQPEHPAIVVGAHYDSVTDVPGADDNASGAAVVVELARALARERLRRTVRFVLFTTEEPPYFQSKAMGSLVYARRLERDGIAVAGMLSIESIGYYDEAEGSQQYPFPFDLVYPSRGDFVGFVGNLRSRRLVRRSVGVFRSTTPFPSQGVAATGRTPGIGWSDHWAFWQIGVPAAMVTDTAPFRNPNYHRASDAWSTLDYERMARVTRGLERVVRSLADDGV